MKKKNIIAKDLRTKKYKMRIVKAKKGKGSFKRKKINLV
ncbi:ribosome alternative rescue factor ArfA [Pelagibacterales bacterium SAG-MED20]|nr:ribosome alternative rescue factor ArfA [Pelagibacterales bacterium SAG-MED20]